MKVREHEVDDPEPAEGTSSEPGLRVDVLVASVSSHIVSTTRNSAFPLIMRA